MLNQTSQDAFHSQWLDPSETTTLSRTEWNLLAPPCFPPFLLRRILLGALQQWPHHSYAELRVAYARGQLTITPTAHPNGYPAGGLAFLVNYDGIEICVLIPGT